MFEFLKLLLEQIKPPTPALAAMPDPDGDGQLVVIQDGYSLEELPGPSVNKRQHTFHDLDGFAAWLNKHAEGFEQDVEVLFDEQLVRAALAPRDVDGDVVDCRIEFEQSFLDWKQVFGRGLGQKALYSFVRGHMGDFADAKNKQGQVIGKWGELLSGQLQNLKVTSSGEYQVQMDRTGAVTMAGIQQSAQVQGTIPPEFEVDIPLIRGVCDPETGKARSYTLHILVDIEADGKSPPAFTLTCPNLKAVQAEAHGHAVAWLTHLLSQGFLVGRGELDLTSRQAAQTSPKTPTWAQG